MVLLPTERIHFILHQDTLWSSEFASTDQSSILKCLIELQMLHSTVSWAVLSIGECVYKGDQTLRQSHQSQSSAEAQPTTVSETTSHQQESSSRFMHGFSASPANLGVTITQPTQFQHHFVGEMTLYSDPQTVTDYLDAHQGWFCRCAQPMQVEPKGDNGYVLTVGRYGSFGFELEPKVGLHLLPQEQGVYRIETFPLPDKGSYGYHVDFQASLNLVDTLVPANVAESAEGSLPLTRVEWQLDLGVGIFFPKFIQKLPQKLIQRTGDALLKHIVHKVSQCLTAKVQDDFHRTYGITIPQTA